MAKDQKKEISDDNVAKNSKLPLILGLVLALIGGGGGFYATWSGMIFASGDSHPKNHPQASDDYDPLLDIAFVPIEPITISLRGDGPPRHLRFRAQLEVPKSKVADVELLMPRVVDILNGYLRALDTSDIESVAALARLRGQMLRRVQIVMGDERVNDLLIMEFVIT